jgi:hypothetical protein
LPKSSCRQGRTRELSLEGFLDFSRIICQRDVLLTGKKPTLLKISEGLYKLIKTHETTAWMKKNIRGKLFIFHSESL